MKKSLLYSSIVGLGLLASGCNDFLDKNPDNRSDITDKTKVDALLVSAYNTKTNMTLLSPRCDYMTDNGATFRGSQPSATFDYVLSGFLWDEYTKTESGNDSYEQFWTGSYQAIAAANQALASIEQIGGGKEYASARAEALICRAYNHFTLLTMFSNMFDRDNMSSNLGIPYVKEPENVVIKRYERGTVAGTLTEVMADFQEGLKNIGGPGDYKQPKFHFTRDAANAFGVRLSLYTEDYAAAINYASSLIPTVNENNLRPLQNKGKPVVNANGDTALYVVPTDAAVQFCLMNMHDWNEIAKNAGGSDGMGMEFSGAEASSNLLVSECMTTIERATSGTLYVRHGINTATLRAMMSNASGAPTLLPAFGYSGDPSLILPKFYEDFKITSSSGGITTGFAYAKIPLLRLEEVLLGRAEAYAMLGQFQSALNDLNMWYKLRADADAGYSEAENTVYRDGLIRAYGSAINSSDHFINSSINSARFSDLSDENDIQFRKALILAILDARNVEFLQEGIRYFDILRWNIPVTHRTADGKSSTLTYDDDRRVIQLPESVTLSDVEPNPWNPKDSWK